MKNKIAIFGSSVAYGEGGVDNKGWVFYLTEMLDKEKYEIENQSICGDNAKKLLKRVNTSILNKGYDFVIIAISLGNEGIVHPFKRYRFNVFFNGVKSLVQLFNTHKIKTIITNVYPNQLYSKKEYRFVEEMNIKLESLNVPIVNVGGTVDDLSGKWIEGLYIDNAHPNDKGHTEMAYSFSKDMLEKYKNNPSSKILSNGIIDKKIKIKLSQKIRSFSLSFEYQVIKEGVFIELNKECEITCRKNALYLNNVKFKTGKFITMMYHPYLSEFLIYIDGILVYKCDSICIDIEEMWIDTTIAKVKHLMLHRGRISPTIIKMMSEGYFYKSSLEIYAPLDKESNERYKNHSCTNSTVIEIN